MNKKQEAFVFAKLKDYEKRLEALEDALWLDPPQAQGHGAERARERASASEGAKSSPDA